MSLTVTTMNKPYSPYQLTEGPGQNIENTTQQHLILGTLGIKF
ncbi:MAG: hypothetical protein R2806_10450 [Saprospiraceae bacterium]